MLNVNQSNRLEKLQRDILKTIYGFGRSYSEILETENIETLAARRQNLFDSYALKMWENKDVSYKSF